MKKYIKRVLLFSAAGLMLIFLFDMSVSRILQSDRDYASGETAVWHDLYDGRVNADIVIYGSSRAWRHFDADLMQTLTGKSVYNLGIDGHNFNLQLLRHKTLLANNSKPSLIIMSMDIFTLQKRKDLYNYEQFLPFMLFNSEIERYTRGYEGFGKSDFYIPMLRYTGNLTALKEALLTLTGRDTEFRKNGFRPGPKEWTDQLDGAINEQGTYTIRFDAATIQQFEEFIQSCADENIDLILVYSPEYFAAESFVTNRDELFVLVDSLAEKWSVPFINYYQHPISREKKYFYNSQHLNGPGAEVFTRMLTEEQLKDR